MLVLTRSTGQTITIGNYVVVMVTKIKNGTVTLGVQAPKEIRVNRGEITAKLRARQMEVVR